MILLLKTVAVILICSGFALGGIYFAGRHERRAQIVSDILLMLSVTETQLRYACMPVSDLLRVLCETDKLKNLKFIEKCRSGVESGEPFPDAWRKAVESDAELCPLLRDRSKYLIRLGSDIGATDIESQLGCCEYYKQIFEKELAQCEENRKKYSKLYPALGLTLGISAAIIII